MAEVKKLAEGTVPEAEKKLGKLSDAELTELHDIEHGADNPRTTLLDAIHREQDKRKGEAAPKKGEVDADEALRARNATMEPAGSPNAVGQIGTVAG